MRFSVSFPQPAKSGSSFCRFLVLFHEVSRRKEEILKLFSPHALFRLLMWKCDTINVTEIIGPEIFLFCDSKIIRLELMAQGANNQINQSLRLKIKFSTINSTKLRRKQKKFNFIFSSLLLSPILNNNFDVFD